MDFHPEFRRVVLKHTMVHMFSPFLTSLHVQQLLVLEITVPNHLRHLLKPVWLHQYAAKLHSQPKSRRNKKGSVYVYRNDYN